MEKIHDLKWALAKVVRKARLERGQTQSQLAGLAGLAEMHLSQLERGVRGDSLNAFLLLASALEMRGSELLRLVEEELERGVDSPAPKIGRPPK